MTTMTSRALILPQLSKQGLIPPLIQSVTPDIKRPKWSVMVPTYNCATYLRKTLESVLEQDPGTDQMQIEVVDDCSTIDDPEAVVREVGKGRVKFFRKSHNAGPVKNFNTCITRSTGHLVHILHGDDYVLPGFYDEISNLTIDYPDCTLYASRYYEVNQDGIVLNVSSRLPTLEESTRSPNAFYYSTQLQFCGVVIKRDFWSIHGGFLTELIHTADCEMWARAVSIGGGVVTNKVLTSYRIFESNHSSRLMQSGNNIRDIQKLHTLFACQYADYDQQLARSIQASLALDQAKLFRMAGDNTASKANYELYKTIIRSMPILTRFRRRMRILKQAFTQ
ncbi:glycosyltransferase family 2 protein [Cyanobium sp. AMD-g]|uniref:glycosyltransferase family 2 protein n=1 Tax=Cyanobium sp. AMD-g TaxID=2823699 RepID=UPI0020CD5D92|nr:glycosyltransferase family 2 protein [Cyanobium sp. AMD-g]MCP9929776.1 glycosyltransferase family 2 protein [Cyanobium sp. AMD-g]